MTGRAGPVTLPVLRRSRVAVLACFFVLGIGDATWAARLPAIKAALHLSDGRLGLALFAAPCGSVATLVLSGRLTDRFGPLRVVRVAGLLLPAALVGIGLAGSLPTLMLAFAGYGACGGMLDVSMNACGTRVEAAYGRPILSSLHGGYSAAGLIGAGIAGGFAALSIGPLPTFVAVACLLVATAAIAGSQIVLPPVQVQAPSGLSGDAARQAARQIAIVIAVLGLLALCGQLSEGSARDWSAVYLHVNRGTSAGVAAMGLAAFSVTMAVGRMAGDRLAHRFGPVRLVRCSGLVAGLGLGAGLLIPGTAAAIAGFALLGAGLAGIFPQLISAAARLDPEHVGRNIGRIAAIAYTGLLGGPVIIGAVASAIGLRDALLIPAALALLVALLAGTVLSGTAPTDTAPASTEPADTGEQRRIGMDAPRKP